MFIVLPDEIDGLDSVENKIAMSNFEAITAGLQEVGRVQLNLPMFKIETKINLKGILKKVSIMFLRTYFVFNTKVKCRFLNELLSSCL